MSGYLLPVSGQTGTAGGPLDSLGVSVMSDQGYVLSTNDCTSRFTQPLACIDLFDIYIYYSSQMKFLRSWTEKRTVLEL